MIACFFVPGFFLGMMIALMPVFMPLGLVSVFFVPVFLHGSGFHMSISDYVLMDVMAYISHFFRLIRHGDMRFFNTAMNT